MNAQGRAIAQSRSALLGLMTLLAGALILLPLAGADAKKDDGRKGGKGPAVKLSLLTATQTQLLNVDAVEVSVNSNRNRKVSLSALQGKTTGIATPDTVKVKAGEAELVRLPLTAAGRQVFASCGNTSLTVQARYRGRTGKSGQTRSAKKKKTRTRSVTRNLTPRLACGAAAADGCDPIDPAACYTPFPNDYFTVPDPTTGTGLRLNLQAENMPRNLNGTPVFSDDFNRNDGFSPNNVIVTKVPGIETPATFQANEIVPQVDIGKYDDPTQRVVLINADTGQRHPIWAELDMVPGTPNPHDGGAVNGTPNDRMLLIHPATALEYGTRYIVALRDLEGAGAVPLEPNPTFKAYRDNTPTGDPIKEARRADMEDIFSKLGAAGIGRGDLYLAWDFTVASEDGLTERLRAMRDDAFDQLGDTDLSDFDITGTTAPVVKDLQTTQFALCDSDSTPECELTGPNAPQSDYAFRRVTGKIEVPCYMDAPTVTYNPLLSDPQRVPCAAGSRLHYAPGADVPSQNGNATWDAPFTCVLPRTGDAVATGATGRPGVVFGHGLLGNHRAAEQIALFPGALEGIACGTDWIGLSGTDSVAGGGALPEGDLIYLFNVIGLKQDLSLFDALPERSQQGFLNTLYLGRAMAHPSGFASKAAFQYSGVPAIDVNQANTSEDLTYLGGSLGGIFGAATTSVAPDWERAVLSVPGVGFTTLLSRSTQFNEFLPAVYDAYPDALSRQLGMSMLQIEWDRGEPSAYIHNILDGMPNTPSHKVLLQEAFGDHQVANIQTQTMARSMGAAVRVRDADVAAPAGTSPVDVNRLDDRPDTDTITPGPQPYLFSDTINPFWLPTQDIVDPDDLNVAGGYTGADAAYTAFDTGPIPGMQPFNGTNANPDWNIAPVGRSGATPNDGLDPHAPAASSPKGQQIALPFLKDQGIFDACVSGAPGPLVMPPWVVPYTGMAEHCTAPPVNSIGQGL